MINSKDAEKITKYIRDELKRMFGMEGNQKKALNLHFLISSLRSLEEINTMLGQKLNDVAGQMDRDQAKMRILEKFIDDEGLVAKYQIFLDKMNTDLDKAEDIVQP